MIVEVGWFSLRVGKGVRQLEANKRLAKGFVGVDFG